MGEIRWPAEGKPVQLAPLGSPTDFALDLRQDHSLDAISTDGQAVVLWLDFEERLAAILDAWRVHVKQWISEGLTAQDRFTFGASIHTGGELSLVGFYREGLAVVEFSSMPLDSRVQVAYFTHLKNEA